ncbi:NAD(P)H-dependent oxidoreductase subunit E [Candidatus Woesearchaeota archaeon]|nr:NAD(P)H-dependent oxidoreductase subunit E [Candidatus Woesearchaeota archaeon]
MEKEGKSNSSKKIEAKKSYNLIAELQDIQEKKEFLPKSDLISLSKRTRIPLTDIYGVATFYAQFKLVKQAKNKIYICDGTACHVRHSTDLIKEFTSELKINVNETTPDGLFTIETVRCLGLCASAPVVKINEQVYAKLKKEDVKKIIDEYKKNEQ